MPTLQPLTLYLTILYSAFPNSNTRVCHSSYRAITDPKLFDLVEQILTNLNTLIYNKAKELKVFHSYDYFQLHRNDITHMRYEKGGFYKRHRRNLTAPTSKRTPTPFNSFHASEASESESIQEFRLVLCVTPAAPYINLKLQGGHISIYSNSTTSNASSAISPTTTKSSFETSIPGNGILFRKDLEHEGSQVLYGEQHLITANVWCTSRKLSTEKQQSCNDGIGRIADSAASSDMSSVIVPSPGE